MRAATTALSDHLDGEVTTLATCWRVQRRDGVALGFTTHDRPLLIDGFPYRPSSAFSPTAIAAGQMFEGDDLEVEGALSDKAIRAADLRAGLYDFAMVELFIVNWAAPEAGIVRLKSGQLGAVHIGRGSYVAELHGLAAALQQRYGHVYSAECQADLGDARCRVDLERLTVRAAVVAAVDRRQFTTSALGQPDRTYAYGRLRWLSGDNAGRAIEVKAQTGDLLTLYDAMPAAISPGDLFTLSPGCDKRFSTCRLKFDNVLNFRGHPHLPGMDAVLAYPGLA